MHRNNTNVRLFWVSPQLATSSLPAKGAPRLMHGTERRKHQPMGAHGPCFGSVLTNHPSFSEREFLLLLQGLHREATVFPHQAIGGKDDAKFLALRLVHVWLSLKNLVAPLTPNPQKSALFCSQFARDSVRKERIPLPNSHGQCLGKVHHHSADKTYR